MEELEEIIMAVEELDDDLLKIYRRVINYWRNKCQNLESDKEELEYHIEVLEEKIKKIEDDRDENYRPIPMSEQLDISDRNFI